MTWIWIFLAALVGAAGVRYRLRTRRATGPVPRVDDAALRAILHQGRLSAPDDDEPLEPEDAASAEEAFWSETWDEPEEYRHP